MNPPDKLRLGAPLPPNRWRAIRRRLELDHQKWDAQVGDETALACAPLLMRLHDWRELEVLAETLFNETLRAEQELLERPELHRVLGLPREMARTLQFGGPTPSAGRVMRFDFHWTTDGWRLSEVNSDVPGGYSEATHLARLVAAELPGSAPTGDPTAALVAVLSEAAAGGPVALTCAPGFMEDQQVVSHLARALALQGQAAELASLEQLVWQAGRASLRGREIGAIFRFFQAEWLAKASGAWHHLVSGGLTPCANPGSAALTESKRFPLVWDRLQTPLPTWRQLLPETRSLAEAPWAEDEQWLLKSAYCNNGDTVSIRSAMSRAAWSKRSWQARLQPGQWLAQRRFEVVPLVDEGGALFPCVGVFVVNGRASGAYARVTRRALIDFTASDAALLVYDEE